MPTFANQCPAARSMSWSTGTSVSVAFLISTGPLSRTRATGLPAERARQRHWGWGVARRPGPPAAPGGRAEYRDAMASAHRKRRYAALAGMVAVYAAGTVIA